MGLDVRTLVVAGLVSTLVTPPVFAQDRKDTSSPVITAAPVYRPPLRGAPGGRVGGGTRGTGHEPAFVLSAMAPEHTGLTVTEQPTLYWFISAPTSHPIEITIVDPAASEPLVEMRLDPPVTSGVHAVSLAERGVRLASGVVYQWYVAVVPDDARRSKDILAGGAVERVEPPADVAAAVKRASRSELPALFAGAGLWYDAISTLGDLIAAAPNDRALVEQRAALLRQAGLPELKTSR
jgi:uncharacterized protein DUF928